jgi:hypothetical protein
MISVICVTNRCGGLDLLADSLRRQSYRDWELVLVDAIRPYRQHYSFPSDMRAQWLDPGRTDRFAPSYMRSQNMGIEHARGETVVYMCDYSHLNDDCLAVHAAAQKEQPGPFMADYLYRTPPAWKEGLPNYRESATGTKENAAAYGAETEANAARYEADLKSGRLDPYMWSAFAEPLTPESVAALPVEHEHRPSGSDAAVRWNHVSLKNESYPTELLLELNGHDELFDQSHGWQDQELAFRLRARGIGYRVAPPGVGMVSVVNPRAQSNIKRLVKPLFFNEELCFNSRRAELGLPVNPGFSLRDRRKARLGL